jgi:ribosomal-protein-alanine N-acetyltransferase
MLDGVTEILRTDRLRLRELTIADADGLLEIFGDQEAMRYYPATKDRTGTEGWIHWCLKSYQQNGFGLWAIERAADDTFLGDCGLMLQRVEGRQVPEIGYHLLPGEWGRGYATEAAGACRDWLFRETTYQEVVSIVDPANRRSRAVAERVHARMRPIGWGSQARTMCLYSTARTDLEPTPTPTAAPTKTTPESPGDDA